MAEPQTAYLPDLLECKTCGCKILVERFLCGWGHTLAIVATCGTCLPAEPREGFREEQPGVWERVQAWLRGEKVDG